MTLMCKINKLEKLSGPQGNFHTLFGRSPTFYDHFQVDVVTLEWSTGISSSPVTQTNLLNELNLPQSITFPIPTSLPLKLTLTQETTSLLPFSSKFTFLGNKNSCDGHVSFPPSKNSGPFHHNKQLFTLPTEYSLVQISWIQRCRYKTPIFYINIFPYCFFPILDSNLPFFTSLLNPPQRNLQICLTKTIFYRHLFLHCQLDRYHQSTQQQTSH